MVDASSTEIFDTSPRPSPRSRRRGCSVRVVCVVRGFLCDSRLHPISARQAAPLRLCVEFLRLAAQDFFRHNRADEKENFCEAVTHHASRITQYAPVLQHPRGRTGTRRRPRHALSHRTEASFQQRRDITITTQAADNFQWPRVWVLDDKVGIDGPETDRLGSQIGRVPDLRRAA